MMREWLVALVLWPWSGCPEARPVDRQVWPYAVAMADCAPWDGAATSVYLTEVPAGDSLPRPHLHLAVYQHLGTVAGRRWKMQGGRPGSLAPTWCPASGACVAGSAGWIEFDRPVDGTALAGRYDVTLADGRRLAGRFTAPVRQRSALCG